VADGPYGLPRPNAPPSIPAPLVPRYAAVGLTAARDQEVSLGVVDAVLRPSDGNRDT